MNKIILPEGVNDSLRLERQLKQKSETDWQKLGERNAISLFRAMADRVPAYKSFLRKNKVDPTKIVDIADFKKLPTINKNNYLLAYSRDQLCWDGNFKNTNWTISTTSGTTGKPYYFPRQEAQNQQYAITAELYLRANFDIQNKSTLYIVGFPMGAWIGGVFTYDALKIIAEKNEYKLSIITPGIHKREIIDAVKQLGPNFDQIIIGSYAPFLKDIVDDGVEEGLKWRNYNVGFVFSAEGFNEVFRDYIIRKTGIKNVYKGTLNHYGTVDMGTMAHETPLCVLLRRAAIDDIKIYKKLFSRTNKLPTLAQYNPAHFYFEEVNGSLLCTANSGIPLVRYDLKDSGGVASLQEVKDSFASEGYNYDKAVKKAGIVDTLWNLPFVYVYERNDLSVSFYAFQIYPETIRRALQNKKLHTHLTGKFSMSVEFDEQGQQLLIINVELRPNQEESKKLHSNAKKSIIETLLTESSEYRETHIMYGERVYPEIVFWPYEDTTHFKPGGKQKWVKK